MKKNLKDTLNKKISKKTFLFIIVLQLKVDKMDKNNELTREEKYDSANSEVTGARTCNEPMEVWRLFFGYCSGWCDKYLAVLVLNL